MRAGASVRHATRFGTSIGLGAVTLGLARSASAAAGRLKDSPFDWSTAILSGAFLALAGFIAAELLGAYSGHSRRRAASE